MAASTVLSRLSCRSSSLALKFASRSTKPSVSPLKSSSQSQVSASTKRTSRIPRLPVQMSSLVSMMPLHSAIASARLTSVLSVESQSWGLIPQGESLYLPLPFCFFACKMKN
ncbi:hypothetical protein CK203_003873 [Vitis vinifera]|uniref:Protein NUCLEAR FUSION DEFECTIVE 6, chloroplastic/mitochondrial n=1 Tax=Vitis vinifera TaxID=29760 RepID=A0A438K8N1_VITVI|nr:hypothetical protein CK203_003873 [Vitis vinifera]